MKKRVLIITALILFTASIYFAFISGKLMFSDALIEGQIDPVGRLVVYAGFKGKVAEIFALGFGVLLKIFNQSVLVSTIVLALIVELILLYPSVRIQLKQKKIHILHRKLIDRFNSGELSVSSTEQEIHRIYNVNEEIHNKGAWLVGVQMILLFFTFWGLNLIIKSPEWIQNSWSILNFTLLSKANTIWLPLMTSFIYLFHAWVKIYYKQREDYIGTSQITMAFVFSLIGAMVAYYFATIFATALVIYFATLITFSTIRYLIVEKHTRDWGKMVQQELIESLQASTVHKNRFEYFSRLWNQLPIIRHINFNLLEEALSMTLGLLLVLTFFGAFEPPSGEALTGSQIQATMIQMEVKSLLK